MRRVSGCQRAAPREVSTLPRMRASLAVALALITACAAEAPDDEPIAVERGVVGAGGACDRAEGEAFADQPYQHTRYVSVSGSNGHSGESAAQAWRTISHALAHAPPDTTIRVASGVYDECVRFSRKDLSPTAPLRLQAIERHGAVIDPSPSRCGAGDVFAPASGQKYVVVDGFRIEGGNGAAPNNRGGFFFYTTSANVDHDASWVKWIVLRDNRIARAGHDGIKITLCDRCYLLDNEVIDSGRTNPSEQSIDTLGFNHGVIAGNTVRGATNVAIVMKAGSRHSCAVDNTLVDDIQQGVLLGGSSTNDWIPAYAHAGEFEGHRLLAADNRIRTRGWAIGLMGCDTCEAFSNDHVERTTAAQDVFFLASKLAGHHDWDTRDSSVSHNCGPSIQIGSAGLGCGAACNNHHADNGGTTVCEDDEAAPLEDGAVYELEPASAPGRRLDVAGWGTGNGANVQLWSGHGGANQRWRATHVGDGVYRFAPLHAPGLRLDGAGSGNVHLWTAHDGANQRWRVLDVGGGLHELAPLHAPGQRLDAAGAGNGANVHLSTAHGGADQRWRILAP